MLKINNAMGCCGKKRERWIQEWKAASNHQPDRDTALSLSSQKQNRLFEYTGKGSLTTIGVATGKLYHFKGKGDRIAVDQSDSFALMAERELQVL